MSERRPPRSNEMLSRWVDAYARQIGEELPRVRRWIAYLALGGALERAGFYGDGPKFTIKGGVALELRLRARARATRDLDLILNHADADLVEELGSALSQPFEGFSFHRRGETRPLPKGGVRVEATVQYGGRPWARIQIDLSRRESDVTECEMVDAIDFSALRLEFPRQLPCLSLHAQAAQKIHAVTRPSTSAWRNDRFKDLVDLLLMRELITDLAALRSTCVQTFERRAVHAWPPSLDLHEHWEKPFERMATEIRLPVTDLGEAVARIRAFLLEIDLHEPSPS